MKSATLNVNATALWKTLAAIKSTRTRLTSVVRQEHEYRIEVDVTQAKLKKIAKRAGYSKEQIWRIFGI